DLMELFANLYGSYPFDDEKYGHCMAPLGGGMEHQTMTTQGWFNKGLTSHELGHQWWGDNVTCASWADIWVNEGFATYSSYLMLENLYPNETTTDMNSKHANIKSSPGGSVWCLDSLNEGRIFSGRLSYDKGAAIIHTFRFLVNDDQIFFNTLKQIQTDFTDSTIHGIVVRDYLSNASGVDLTNAFNEWYFGEGFPTYSARWNMVGNDFLLEINQTTSSSTPLFTNELELRLSRQSTNDTIIRIPISNNTQQYSIPDLGNVIQLSQIDPNNWIINNQGAITHDQNFTAVGLDEINKNIEFSISPNPSSGVFKIEANQEGIIEVSVYDLNGRNISSFTFSKDSSFDLSQEENGYYIVHLTNESGAKIVKTIEIMKKVTLSLKILGSYPAFVPEEV
ncbi:MAG: T9SS type A sorting domain-containing protein, partial [Desulfobacula sp.]|nr:T9SS type A sorting domain-containing protein [Desulfobacula sp.]